MSGRNVKPDNDGPASAPSRLDQFGDKLAAEGDRYEDAVIEVCEDAEDTEERSEEAK